MAPASVGLLLSLASTASAGYLEDARSNIAFSNNVNTTFVAAADTAGYGPPGDYRKQTLSGQVIIDPQVLAFLGSTQPELSSLMGFVNMTGWGPDFCHPATRMTQAEVQGKVVLFLAAQIVICILEKITSVETFFMEMYNLGAAGLIGFMDPFFGTRWT